MKPSSQPSRTPSKFSNSCAFLFVACLFLSGVSSAAPYITLSKKSGPPTSQILVSGRGFEPNVGVDIYFDTKDEALVVTNSKGEFKHAKAHAPRSARPGQHWVTALERNNDKGAQKPFLVQTNWSQFHFTADGTRWNQYENVLNPKNAENLGVKWTYSAKGAIGSSAAVVDGVLYIGGSWFDNHLYAINANTGALLWSYAANGSTYTSPAAADGIVYFGSSDDNLYALDARTGMVRWIYETGGYVGNPTVVGGVAYVGSGDGSLYALNAHTGAKIWSYATEGSIYSAVVADGVVYFGSDDDNVYALQASNGALLWKYKTGSYAGDVAVTTNVVYATSQDGNTYALLVVDGEKLWSYPAGSGTAPAFAYDAVYVSSGRNIYALNARTGAELWSFVTGNPVVGSPAVANGVVYATSTDANVYALDAHTGVELWNYTTGDVVPSSPTVVNGVLYVGSYDAHVYAFSLSGGGRANQDGVSPPDISTLRPDLSLKVSNYVATVAPHASRIRMASADQRWQQTGNCR